MADTQIPKIIHYCWFGGNPIPDSAKPFIESWKRFLPDYEIMEWNESNFDVNSYAYAREAYDLGLFAFVSDIARLHALHEYGGIYFDLDVEVVKPLDEILARGPFMGYEQGDNGETSINDNLNVATGLGLGAEKGNPFLGEILEHYKHIHLPTWTGIMTITTVGIISELIAKYPIEEVSDDIHYRAGFYIYSAEYMCPMNYLTGNIIEDDRTITIHRYAATWVRETHTIKEKIVKRSRYIWARLRSTLGCKVKPRTPYATASALKTP